MIQKYFFLLLIFLPCFAQGSTDIDEKLEKLHKMDVVLQDSVSYLIKQVDLLKEQLADVTAKQSNQPDQTKIGNLEKGLKLSQKKIIQLVMWKKVADYKLNHPNCSMNITQLDQHLLPISHSIKTLNDDVNSLKQQETAVQRTVSNQVMQMGGLFKTVKELKDKTSSHIENNMELLKKHLFQFRKMVITLSKKYSDFGKFKVRMNEIQGKLLERMNQTEIVVEHINVGLRNFAKSKKKTV